MIAATATAPAAAEPPRTTPRQIVVALRAGEHISDQALANAIRHVLSGWVSPAMEPTLEVNVATLTEAEDVVFRRFFRAGVQAPAMQARQEPPPAVDPVLPDTMTQGEIYRNRGFTGDACVSCGSFEVVRTGNCKTCQQCGHNGGCG